MTTHRDYLLGRVQQTYERLRGLHDGPKGFVGHRYVCYTVSEGGTFRHCPAEFYPEIVKEGGIYETNMDDYRTPVRYVRLVEVIDDYDFTIERQRETKKGEQPPGGVHDEA